MREGPEWFSPKRYGYGSGLPIAWQGWAVLAIYLVAILSSSYALGDEPLLLFAIVIPLTAVLVFITAKTTRGGWQWRWGEKE